MQEVGTALDVGHNSEVMALRVASFSHKTSPIKEGFVVSWGKEQQGTSKCYSCQSIWTRIDSLDVNLEGGRSQLCIG